MSQGTALLCIRVPVGHSRVEDQAAVGDYASIWERDVHYAYRSDTAFQPSLYVTLYTKLH